MVTDNTNQFALIDSLSNGYTLFTSNNAGDLNYVLIQYKQKKMSKKPKKIFSKCEIDQSLINIYKNKYIQMTYINISITILPIMQLY